MSGYLRWLAARALGRSSGVRPVRRPPYFAAALPTIAPPIDAVESAPRAPLPETEAAAQLASPAGPPAPVEAPDAAISVLREPDASQSAARGEGRAEPAAAQRGEVTAEPRAAPAARAPDAPSGQRIDLVRVEQPEPPDRARSIGPAVGAEAPTRRRPVQRDADSIVPTHRLRAAASAERPGRGADAALPDVHIHIGRVELTAITPPAVARREPATSAKKPMSLEDYLRRRGGRSS